MKLNSRQFTVLNLGTKGTVLLEENVRENISYSGLGKDSLGH